MDHKIIEQLRAYNKQDCTLLYRILRKFEADSSALLGEYPLHYPTLTSYSYHVFKTKLAEAKITVPGSLEDEFMRVGYHGGRTEVFKPYAKAGEGNYGLDFLDFTSLYPAVCLYTKMPTGWAKKTHKYESDKLGMYLCFVK